MKKKQHIRPERIDISARHETAITHHTMGKMRNFELKKGYKGHGLRDPRMGLESSYKDIKLNREG